MEMSSGQQPYPGIKNVRHPSLTMNTNKTADISPYHPRSSVMCLNVALQMLFSDCLDVLCRSKNSSTQRSVLESSCMQMVKYNLLCLSLNLQAVTSDKLIRV